MPEQEKTEDERPEPQGGEEESVVTGADAAEGEEQKASGAQAETGRSGGKGWLLVIIILAGLPAAGWFLLPEDMRDTLRKTFSIENMKSVTPIRTEAPAPVEPAPAPEPVAAPEPEPVQPILPEDIATSEEVRALMRTIDALRGEMGALQSEQSALRQDLRARQQLELRMRLRRLIRPDVSLTQMAAYWQDIALLPILSGDERQKAESLRERADSNAAMVAAWRRHLEGFAERLSLPAGEDIIPKRDDSWWGWIADQFHLRRVPLTKQRELLALRKRLLTASHDLAVERWPETKPWNRLLSDLRAQFGDEADRELPERFKAIQEDIQAMRDSAGQWLEQL